MRPRAAGLRPARCRESMRNGHALPRSAPPQSGNRRADVRIRIHAAPKPILVCSTLARQTARKGRLNFLCFVFLTGEYTQVARAAARSIRSKRSSVRLAQRARRVHGIDCGVQRGAPATTVDATRLVNLNTQSAPEAGTH
jgi:hypothetical protein